MSTGPERGQRWIDSLRSRSYVAGPLRLALSILALAALTAVGARAEDESAPAPVRLPPVVVTGSPIDPFETSADVHLRVLALMEEAYAAAGVQARPSASSTGNAVT